MNVEILDTKIADGIAVVTLGSPRLQKTFVSRIARLRQTAGARRHGHSASARISARAKPVSEIVCL
jgi:hypothetical protein